MELRKIVSFQITMTETELAAIADATGLGYDKMGQLQRRTVDEFRDFVNDAIGDYVIQAR